MLSWKRRFAAHPCSRCAPGPMDRSASSGAMKRRRRTTAESQQRQHRRRGARHRMRRRRYTLGRPMQRTGAATPRGRHRRCDQLGGGRGAIDGSRRWGDERIVGAHCAPSSKRRRVSCCRPVSATRQGPRRACCRARACRRTRRCGRSTPDRHRGPTAWCRTRARSRPICCMATAGGERWWPIVHIAA